LQTTSNKTSYTKITAKIMGTTLIITLIIAYIYGEYLKQDSIEKLSKADAKQTSMFIFESLYSAMAKGWNKEELTQIVHRLNQVNKDLKIDVYRSNIVVKDFDDFQKDKIARETNINIQEAMKGQEILNILENENIEYFYPIIAKQECLKCHLSAKEKNVLGVINITYPVIDLKVSLSEMINFFIYFIIIFTTLLFTVLFFEFNRHLLQPIKNFVKVIHTISSSRDLTKRIDIIDDVEEIGSMQTVFNTMLDSIEFQFYNDNLTLLPNRRKLIESLDNTQHRVLMIINIDKFQEINDLYGHVVGDEILKQLALFLKEEIEKDTLLFKLNSDEYAILFNQNYDLDYFTTYSNILLTNISKENFNIDNLKNSIFINCTIGIAHGNNSLLTNADIALKIAKKRKQHFLIYDPSMQVEHEYEQNFKWTKKIKDAIENDKIVPLFQPIVDCKTLKTIKYESLMRMVDENGEYIAPVYFLELAKKNKLYSELTKIIINKTFDIFENLDYIVSINLSVDDILNQEIITLITQRLSQSDIGNKIVFEIIESEGIENFKSVVEFINEVKPYGCKISIDDFGTGYSNFEYLMKLKVDYIKIDASMIKNIDVNNESKIITETIVDFAKKLNIKTVGEFVYSKEVFETIQAVGVDYAQGYYFGKPALINHG